MAELPKLPERTIRLQILRWNALIETHGFTGAHFEWHQSSGLRHEAARPLYSLAPPPATQVGDRTDRRTTLHGKLGQPVSYEGWLGEQMAAWHLRESDPTIVDSIGVVATVTLAKARFGEIIIDYLNFWATGTHGNSDEFHQWAIGIARSVSYEVSEVWRKNEWHEAQFRLAQCDTFSWKRLPYCGDFRGSPGMGLPTP